MNKTNWFDGNKFVPAHVGLYERDMDGLIFKTKWSGDCWLYADATDKSFRQNLDWRGLKDKP